MKQVRLLFLLTILLTPIVDVFSQFTVDSVRYAESMWAAERRAYVFQFLLLTEAEKAAFLPLYEWYNIETKYLDKEYMYLIKTYGDGDDLSGEQLEKITSQIIKNELALAAVRKRFHRKFRKAISPGKASLFMQLDNTFRVVKRQELYMEIGNIYTKEF